MRQPTKPAIKADNPRLRMVRIDIGGDARNYTTGQQRVTVVPLTIRRKQNRKVMIPPTWGRLHPRYWRPRPADDQDVGQSFLLAAPAR
jgi:hypothetical protein